MHKVIKIVGVRTHRHCHANIFIKFQDCNRLYIGIRDYYSVVLKMKTIEPNIRYQIAKTTEVYNFISIRNNIGKLQWTDI